MNWLKFLLPTHFHFEQKQVQRVGDGRRKVVCQRGDQPREDVHRGEGDQWPQQAPCGLVNGYKNKRLIGGKREGFLSKWTKYPNKKNYLMRTKYKDQILNSPDKIFAPSN
jgi:hypothetical protein